MEFRDWCRDMTVFGYRFERVLEYQQRLQSLQHHVTVHSEFEIRRNTGGHAVTAHVEIPQREEAAVIGDLGKERSALADILLLISLFTGRDVFTLPSSKGQDDDPVIVADHRLFPWGGALQCSIPYKASVTDDPLHACDVGLEEGLNAVYERVRKEDWQRKYQYGHFLLLANHAFRQYDLATAFTQCWTIWEHLFSVLSRAWLSEEQLRHIHGSEKIAFLLVQYGFAEEIVDSDKRRIEGLVSARNSLVHFGCFPAHGSVHKSAILFIRLTEFLTAKILGLWPSDVFDTMKEFEEFLKPKSKSESRSRRTKKPSSAA